MSSVVQIALALLGMKLSAAPGFRPEYQQTLERHGLLPAAAAAAAPAAGQS